MKTVLEYLKSIDHDDHDRHENWRTYRKQVTAYITRMIETYHPKSLCLIGSGKLDDLDLTNLMQLIDDITMIDLDSEKTIQGIRDQGLDPHDFDIISKDLTGFDDKKIFERLITYLGSNPTVEQTKSFIKQLIDEAMTSSFSDDLDKSFDMIVIMPIYTQLVYHQGEALIKMYRPSHFTDEDVSKVLMVLLDLMIPLIDHINQGIINKLSQGGYVVALSDVLEFDRSQFQTLENKYSVIDQKAMKETYESYFKRYGTGLGDYGLHALKSKLDEIGKQWFLWPYTQNRMMIVQSLTLKKSE